MEQFFDLPGLINTLIGCAVSAVLSILVPFLRKKLGERRDRRRQQDLYLQSLDQSLRRSHRSRVGRNPTPYNPNENKELKFYEPPNLPPRPRHRSFASRLVAILITLVITAAGALLFSYSPMIYVPAALTISLVFILTA